MINVHAADLDPMVAQLRAAGVAVEADTQAYPNGLFAWIYDLKGNPDT